MPARAVNPLPIKAFRVRPGSNGSAVHASRAIFYRTPGVQLSKDASNIYRAGRCGNRGVDAGVPKNVRRINPVRRCVAARRGGTTLARMAF